MPSHRSKKHVTKHGRPQVERANERPPFRLVIPLGLVIVVVLTYAPVVNHEFLNYDDDLLVTKNPHLYPASWAGLRRIWSSGYEGLYMPLTYTSWFALASIGATVEPASGQAVFDPAVFHTFNLVLHVLCVLLVYVLLNRIVGRPLASAAGALLFGLHPLQVESLAWVSETKGLLCAFFSLAAMGAYGEFVQRRNASRRAWLFYGLAACLFFLALLSKPAAVALPLVIWILEVGRWNRRPGVALLPLAPWFACAVGFVLVARYAQPTDQLRIITSLATRFLIAADSLTFYLEKLVWPTNLCPHYPRTTQTAIEDPWLWFRIAIPPLLFVVAAVSARRRRWLTAAGIFVAALLPTLGFVPFAYQEFSNVADRYVYFAMLGPAFALACWLDGPPRRWKVFATLVVFVVLGVVSREQCGYWRDSESLFRHTLAVNPASYRAENGLGCIYLARNDHPRAIPRFRAAIDLKPDYAQAHFNLASSLSAVGENDGAVAHLQKVVELQPDSALARSNLGTFLYRAGRLDEAIAQFERSVWIDPTWTTAWRNLAITLAKRGDLADALAAYDEVLKRDARHLEARWERAEVLAGLGRFSEALQEFALLQRIFTEQRNQQAAQTAAARVSELRQATGAAPSE